MTATFHSLRDHLLISMPHLNDLHFSQTVTYICDHSEYGAMGIVINRPVGITLADLCDHLDILCPSISDQQQPVFFGGPVKPERGYVLHRAEDPKEWPDSYFITDDICLTTSVDIIELAGSGQLHSDYLVALGCAGWGPGQLEQEMVDNSWLSCPANSDILFRIPAEDRLRAAASILGVNLDLLSAQAGHA
ncbi:YqgE/AlgH family protein [Neptuniibacter sp. CAU 1671]|uniref:YqgE/AlgH family protein n=1 Tax=Neptuniibacter sp. CAU 1671 TaxID=3032593 RepID=UPI0023DC4F4F|nr:YqgE/AlgH family protein [Neptuniibacter sp. CAU 1671]MDF2182379.1 YqgE/AlgH family protein [Neptuniibacter sp. CAU 1671]